MMKSVKPLIKNIFYIISWFKIINHRKEAENPFVEKLTKLKIMKLLYYVQGVSLAIYDGRPAFSDKIYAWKFGPVIKGVYYHYPHKGTKRLSIINNNDKIGYKNVESNKKLLNVVKAVNNAYGDMSAIELMKQTHKEAPWLDTRHNDVISPKLIRSYFIKHIISLD